MIYRDTLRFPRPRNTDHYASFVTKKHICFVNTVVIIVGTINSINEPGRRRYVTVLCLGDVMALCLKALETKEDAPSGLEDVSLAEDNGGRPQSLNKNADAEDFQDTKVSKLRQR